MLRRPLCRDGYTWCCTQLLVHCSTLQYTGAAVYTVYTAVHWYTAVQRNWCSCAETPPGVPPVTVKEADSAALPMLRVKRDHVVAGLDALGGLRFFRSQRPQ